MEEHAPTGRRLRFEPGLDGIRGIAVLVVVLWHFGPDIRGRQLAWLKAGHLGVDLFFVLSGFLITALLLDERARSGRISFRGFYRRRVFRLLPALALFLAGHVAFALTVDVAPDPLRLSPGITAGDEVASVVSAAFFVLNWLPELTRWSVAEGMSHLWSLSVEEQFYIVWPTATALLLAGGVAPTRLMSTTAGAAVAAAGHLYAWDGLGSAERWALTAAVVVTLASGLVRIERDDHERWVLAVLLTLVAAVLLYRNGKYEGGFEVFNLYTGTLGRADSLIVGALLAHLWVTERIPRRGPVALALVGWGVIAWAVTQRTLGDPFFYRYGWTLVALAAAAVIWAAIDAHDTRYGRALSTPWLRAIGKVAYGLYLWHALVFTVVHHAWGDESVWLKSVLALGGTAAIVAFSWFFVERPMLAHKNPRARSGAPSRA